MKRALILTPAVGKTERQINRSKQACLQYAVTHQLDPVEFDQEKLDREFVEQTEQIPHFYSLFYVGHVLESMSSCDSVIFGKGWENLLGFKLAHTAAIAYGLEVIYEEKIENERRNQQHENQKTQCDKKGLRHHQGPAGRQGIHA